MLEIKDSNYNWLTRVFDYNNLAQSIRVEFKDSTVSAELILSDDLVTLEARNEKGESVFRSSFKPSELG